MKYLFLTAFISFSFVFPKAVSIKQFQWLEGTWKIENKEVYERWQTLNDTIMGGIGYSYVVKEEEDGEFERELSTNEIMRLVLRGEKFYYLPIVRGQNSGNEVEFEITSFTKKSFVAQNPKHDFPQKIVYELKDATHLFAYIEGTVDGQKKKVEFRFVKQ